MSERAPPSDMESLDTWQALMSPEHAPLIAEAASIDPRDVSALTRLRRAWPAHLVRVALELARARRKAAVKFGERTADAMVCDVAGVEQATSAMVAAHKAQRFATIESTRIIDLCCGIGGDAMALAPVAPTLAVDRRPVRAWMAAVNAHCDSHTADAEDFDPADAAVHIDPSRRADGATRRRLLRYEEYEPGPAILHQLIARSRAAAIKLGPGVNIDAVPTDNATELEFISERGTLVQAVLWSGELAHNPGLRTATTLPAGGTFTGEADQHIATDNFADYVYTIDPAIERSGLLGAFVHATGLPAVHPKVGLLTGEWRTASPWLTPFKLINVLPWRINKVRRWLHEHGAGIVEVKTRGGVVNPDEVQRRLRGGGDVAYTVFVLRFGRSVSAVVTRRLDQI